MRITVLLVLWLDQEAADGSKSQFRYLCQRGRRRRGPSSLLHYLSKLPPLASWQCTYIYQTPNYLYLCESLLEISNALGCECLNIVLFGLKASPLHRYSSESGSSPLESLTLYFSALIIVINHFIEKYKNICLYSLF